MVVGTSIGGAAALDFALTHPEDVAALVLIDAQGFIDGDPPTHPASPHFPLATLAQHPSGHQSSHAHHSVPLRTHPCVWAHSACSLQPHAATQDDWGTESVRLWKEPPPESTLTQQWPRSGTG